MNRTLLSKIRAGLMIEVEAVEREQEGKQARFTSLIQRQHFLAGISQNPVCLLSVNVDGPDLINRWNHEICESLCGLDEEINNVKKRLNERKRVISIIDEVLCSTENVLILAPGGPLHYVDGVLTVRLDHPEEYNNMLEAEQNLGI